MIDEDAPLKRNHNKPDIEIENNVAIRCTGSWTLPQLSAVEKRLRTFSWPNATELKWNVGSIDAMDTAGAWLLRRTMRILQQQGKLVTLKDIRPEHAALLDMLAKDDLATLPPAASPTFGWLAQLGRAVWIGGQQGGNFLSFVGESTLVTLHLLPRPRQMRWRALLHNVQAAGFAALPIVGLLSFLLGVVIAYQAAVQLRAFGANIFIVDLVGISILREIAPLMTAVIVAGRSGSAYTAQIGAMNVTEEIDALRTIGITPIELLVLPKVFALVLALPLLTVFADIIGVFGGAVIASDQLGVGLREFANRFPESVPLANFLIGVGKAPVFAIIIALVGCYQGFQVKGTADSVGQHTTTSVVQSIFLVIVTDAFFSVVFSKVGL